MPVLLMRDGAQAPVAAVVRAVGEGRVPVYLRWDIRL
jgi:hypothetical protein